MNKTIQAIHDGAERYRVSRIIIAWIKDDLPPDAQMDLTPQHVTLLVDRLCGSRTVKARNEVG